MIAVRVKITSYDKENNTCQARLLNGDVICLDPFGCCAISMTDEEYESGLGYDVVGNDYMLIEYTVYKDSVLPSEGGMIKIE